MVARARLDLLFLFSLSKQSKSERLEAHPSHVSDGGGVLLVLFQSWFHPSRFKLFTNKNPAEVLATD